MNRDDKTISDYIANLNKTIAKKRIKTLVFFGAPIPCSNKRIVAVPIMVFPSHNFDLINPWLELLTFNAELQMPTVPVITMSERKF